MLVSEALRPAATTERWLAKRSAKDFDADTGDYSSVWTVARDWDNRTSLVTDPADGKIPPLTAEGRAKAAAAGAAFTRAPNGPELIEDLQPAQPTCQSHSTTALINPPLDEGF